MQTTKNHSKLAKVFMVVFLMSLPLVTANVSAATCVGDDPCHACKNCKYCKRCAKDGKKCGTCK